MRTTSRPAIRPPHVDPPRLSRGRPRVCLRRDLPVCALLVYCKVVACLYLSVVIPLSSFLGLPPPFSRRSIVAGI